MQTSGILPVGSANHGFSQPTAAQISDAATFAEKLAVAVQRERDEKDAIVERAKARYREYLDNKAQEEAAAAEAAAEQAETEKTASSGLNSLFGDNTQNALLMMLAMMAAGGSGGSLGGDSSSNSLTGTSATTEMLIRVVPALMQLSETESRNKQNAAAVAAQANETADITKNV